MAYHHGDLARALIEAGLEATRTGGPDALTIRSATRMVGVSPNAAYRHFPARSALLDAVSDAVQQRMADAMAAADPGLGPRERLRGVGLGYIAFALTEPGWFSVSFFGDGVPGGQKLAATPPFRALTSSLDLLVHTGELPADRRRSAGWACWSAVHGFAELALRGPLQTTDRDELWSHAEATVDAIIRGVCAP
ncbi:TetR/AcrR family transcriptional regulator [Gordonia neofelifaecis]|uniref:Transcriptional regulator, TetR family protein n=1 Tax=Gordonia neofelifaecis NRRL B-59395 TaxID=644548 RepID=F1YMT0_9ACTN|nr:TetR/AcrR family transcriptional regulator [Gordonia neofelifaecis]EGD54015.1 transcriptional regulator, TetR family protein [Gordonia neofelifaecis NRRL B-59395]